MIFKHATNREELEVIQKEADAVRDELRATLTPEELKREAIIIEVRRLLEENNIPFWLFAEEKTPYRNNSYVSHNWFPKEWDENGNYTSAGKNAIHFHNCGLSCLTYDLVHTSLKTVNGDHEYPPEVVCGEIYRRYIMYRNYLKETTNPNV